MLLNFNMAATIRTPPSINQEKKVERQSHGGSFQQLIIGYQGVPGAYSEKALHQLLGSSVRSHGFPTFEGVFQAVANLGLNEQEQPTGVSYGLIPIENSLGGNIHQNYDLLMKYNAHVHIVAELDFRVEHCLLVLPTVQNAQEITKVMSHPQALAQCEQYIRHNLPQATLVPEYDTAGSAELLQQRQLKDTAAIASDLAAQHYGLKVLASNIEDDSSNYTRFLLLAPKAATSFAPYLPTGIDGMDSKSTKGFLNSTMKPSQEMKTSIVFAFEGGNKTGQLHKALSAFSLREIDLTKIESRPQKMWTQTRMATMSSHDVSPSSTSPSSLSSTSTFTTTDAENPPLDRSKYRYLFYADLVGHINETNVKNALNHLQEFCSMVRVLGSYPMNGILLGTLADAIQDNSNNFNHGEKATTTLEVVAAAEAAEANQRGRKHLKIGIIGFGNFGQFLAQTFVRHHRHEVFVTSRSDHSSIASAMGCQFFPMFDLERFLAVHLDVVLISTSIPSFEKVLTAIPSQLLQNCLVVDVLSVKAYPKRLLLDYLPANADILCTHPMFGPESGKYSWRGLPMMYEKVRVCNHPNVCDAFLQIFESERCRMIELTCEEHDKYAAHSQFITHLTGRVLDRQGLQRTPIDTKGFESILTLVDNTCKDSFDLFYGLYKYNTNSMAQIERMENSLREVKRQLTLIDSTQGSAATAGSAAAAATAANLPGPAAADPAAATGFSERRRRDEHGGVPAFRNEHSRLSMELIPKKKEGMHSITKLARSIEPSKTVKLHALTKQMESEGKRVVSLCVGEPDFSPHELILQATKAAVDEGHTKYTGVNGTLPLRTAIAHYLRQVKQVDYQPNEILVSNGAKQSVFQAILSICQEGDEVIVPSPYWVSYPEIVAFSRATCKILPTSVHNDYLVQPNELDAAITAQTKAIIFCNPSNPTGAMHSVTALQALAAVLCKPKNQHVYILADEIYERIVYDVPHVCFASLKLMKDRTLLINGFSKAYAMTGYRLGYLAGPVEIVEAAATLQGQITSCANAMAQHAGVTALQLSSSITDDMVATMRLKRDFVYQSLLAIPHVVCCLPQGAFYMFPNVSWYYGRRTKDGSVCITNCDDLCMYLLDTYTTAVVPGSAFGDENAIRLSYATSMAMLEKAMDNLSRCFASLR